MGVVTGATVKLPLTQSDLVLPETERTRQKFLPGISALVGTALVLVVLAV